MSEIKFENLIAGIKVVQDGVNAIAAAIKEMEQPTQPDQPAPLPDGYRLATEWERQNLPYPEWVEVVFFDPTTAKWIKSNDDDGWSSFPLQFAVPFPPRPTQEWLDEKGLEIVGNWPVRDLERGDMYCVRGYVFKVSHTTYLEANHYKLRSRRPLLRDHNPPNFAELAKEEKLELFEAMLDDPAGVVFQVKSGGEWSRCARAPGAVSFGSTTVYALASQFDLTDSGVDEK
jgi:hypothetical protein